MRERQEARAAAATAHAAIVEYVARVFEDDPDEARRDSLREAYVVGHLAETLAGSRDFDPAVSSIDEHVLFVLSKKGHTPRGQSWDRRTKEEDRAYGNAREAWSYTLREAGAR